MTEARLERIQPDPWLASAFLDRANQFAVDGARADLTVESRQILLHNAVIAACDSVLAITGHEVVGSDGGHQLRLEKVERILPGDHALMFERLDELRALRHQVSYAAAPVVLPEADEAVAAVEELIGLADERVRPHLPEWLTKGEEERPPED